MKLVLIGAPAAGKGTQARRLIAYYGLAYISTGDILREHISKKTEIGIAIKSNMDAGKLVPDEMIIEIVKERIQEDDCKNGFILDGFPRTKVQAEELKKFAGLINRAIYIDVPDEIMLKRITGRLSCPNCGASYHKTSNPPKLEGICDVCQHALKQRKDDTYETGVARLTTFHETAEPLIQYYRERGLLLEVKGSGDIDEITKFIIHELGEKA